MTHEYDVFILNGTYHIVLCFQEHGEFLNDLQKNLSISAMLIADTYDHSVEHTQNLSETLDLLGNLHNLMEDETYSIKSMLCKVHVAMNSTGVHPTSTSNLDAKMIQLPLRHRLGKSSRYTASVGGRIFLTWVMEQAEVMKSRVEQQLVYLLDHEQESESRRVTREASEEPPTGMHTKSPKKTKEEVLGDDNQSPPEDLSITDIELYSTLPQVQEYDVTTSKPDDTSDGLNSSMAIIVGVIMFVLVAGFAFWNWF